MEPRKTKQKINDHKLPRNAIDNMAHFGICNIWNAGNFYDPHKWISSSLCQKQ